MRLQNGGGPVWGGATWSEEGVGAGGRQDADAAEAVAGRTPTARSRGAEGGGGGTWATPGKLGPAGEKNNRPGPKKQ
jgi:hypothetical protein